MTIKAIKASINVSSIFIRVLHFFGTQNIYVYLHTHKNFQAHLIWAPKSDVPKISIPLSLPFSHSRKQLKNKLLRFRDLLLQFSIKNGFRWFWISSIDKSIPLLLVFIESLFLVLHFSYYVSMTFQMMLTKICYLCWGYYFLL